ncbi:MAG: gliding motility-associated ABC transporter ATP-binding subunit GldA [Ginsengibacter sp.]
MAIDIYNLSKLYGTQWAINDISFSIGNNEIVGFLGPNGAGKSTTMKIITGFVHPDSGSVKVNGIDVAANPLEAKRSIGYLPEGNPLYYEMYVREYLEFIAGIHKIKSTKRKIEEIIDVTGLRIESNKKMGQLSKGYKQRVGLAAALLHDPKVVILDEPTTGLDPNQIIEIRKLIKNLGTNKTVLFSSHILQEVENICDRVIIINKGRIVADDTLVTLQSANKSAHTVIVQFGKEINSNLIKSWDGVENIEQISSQYHIQTSAPEKIKKMLLEYSLENNLDILSLQSKSKSLEDVFRNLTN